MSDLVKLLELYVIIMSVGCAGAVAWGIRNHVARRRIREEILDMYNDLPAEFGSHEKFYKKFEDGDEKATHYMEDLLDSFESHVSVIDAMQHPEMRTVTNIYIKYAKELNERRTS